MAAEYLIFMINFCEFVGSELSWNDLNNGKYFNEYVTPFKVILKASSWRMSEPNIGEDMLTLE